MTQGAGLEYSLQAGLTLSRLKPELHACPEFVIAHSQEIADIERASYRPVIHGRDARATIASWHGRPGHDTKLDRFVNFLSTKWTGSLNSEREGQIVTRHFVDRGACLAFRYTRAGFLCARRLRSLCGTFPSLPASGRRAPVAWLPADTRQRSQDRLV